MISTILPVHSAMMAEELLHKWCGDLPLCARSPPSDLSPLICTPHRYKAPFTLLPLLPLDEIRDYFGTKVAMYFAFLQHLTRWLVLPTAFGTFVFIVGISAEGSFDNSYVAVRAAPLAAAHPRPPRPPRASSVTPSA